MFVCAKLIMRRGMREPICVIVLLHILLFIPGRQNVFTVKKACNPFHPYKSLFPPLFIHHLLIPKQPATAVVVLVVGISVSRHHHWRNQICHHHDKTFIYTNLAARTTKALRMAHSPDPTRRLGKCYLFPRYLRISGYCG